MPDLLSTGAALLPFAVEWGEDFQALIPIGDETGAPFDWSNYASGTMQVWASQGVAGSPKLAGAVTFLPGFIQTPLFRAADLQAISSGQELWPGCHGIQLTDIFGLKQTVLRGVFQIQPASNH